MKRFSNVLLLSAVLLMGNACQQAETVRPAIVPGVEVKTPVAPPEPVKTIVKADKRYSLGVIGAIEPIYFLPMKSPFHARIDTGAETSSIDVEDKVLFERDSEKWVSFTVKNRENGETHRFEKKIARQTVIKRIDGSEERVAVIMDVKFGGEIIKTQFTLADRDKFQFQALIGRNILSGRAIVDTSISNTLR